MDHPILRCIIGYRLRLAARIRWQMLLRYAQTATVKHTTPKPSVFRTRYGLRIPRAGYVERKAAVHI